MYKSPSKLPQWQRAPSPAYRRSPFTRYRLLVTFALCFLVWHRYFRVPSHGQLRERQVEESINLEYPPQRELLVTRPRMEDRGDVHDGSDVVPLVKEPIVQVESLADENSVPVEVPSEKIPL